MFVFVHKLPVCFYKINDYITVYQYIRLNIIFVKVLSVIDTLSKKKQILVPLFTNLRKLGQLL